MLNMKIKKNADYVSIWLSIMCILIAFMISLGGFTRLTNSGLSITKWQPISGVIPPTTSEEWERTFADYQHFAEYKNINYGMNLYDFKRIFLVEFIHRIFGRIVVLFYFIPFIFFISKNIIKLKESCLYITVSALMLLQGFIGWYMVKSGLEKLPYISHYRLAIHLLLAVIMFAILFWKRITLKLESISFFRGEDKILAIIRSMMFVMIICLFLQIILGALVSGLNAGLIYNEFPYMGSSFIPIEITDLSVNLVNFDNPVLIQFLHRNNGYLLCILAALLSYYGAKSKIHKLSRIINIIFSVTILQAMLGIATLVFKVPLILAIIHQAGAIILLSFIIYGSFLVKNVKKI